MRWIFLGGVSLLLAIIHLYFDKQTRTSQRIAEVFLLYILSIAVGLNGVYSFLGHFFFADRVAAYIGWPSGNPFQTEVAFANLAIGVLGLLCLWKREGFWLATGIGTAIWLLGASYVHVHEFMQSGNAAAGNIGPVLYSNLLRSVVILGLLVIYQRRLDDR